MSIQKVEHIFVSNRLKEMCSTIRIDIEINALFLDLAICLMESPHHWNLNNAFEILNVAVFCCRWRSINFWTFRCLCYWRLFTSCWLRTCHVFLSTSIDLIGILYFNVGCLWRGHSSIEISTKPSELWLKPRFYIWAIKRQQQVSLHHRSWLSHIKASDVNA